MALSRFARQATQLPRTSWLRYDRSPKATRFLGRRDLVSISTVLEKANNVLPCYAAIQVKLNAQVQEDAGEGGVNHKFVHSTTWSWDGKQIVKQGEGASKRKAKNDAARQVLQQLVSDEGELMDPTRNTLLAEWAINWMNERLSASMDVNIQAAEKQVDEHGQPIEGGALTSHTCTWSCPQLPGETVAHSTGAGSSGESRRQMMSALFKELPDDLEQIIKVLREDTSAPRKKGARAAREQEEAVLVNAKVIANEIVQQLGIRSVVDVAKVSDGFQCTLSWHFYDEATAQQRTEEVVATGRSRKLAAGKATQQMLIKTGHLSETDEAFQNDLVQLKQTLNDGNLIEAVDQAKVLIGRNAADPSCWSQFLPQVLRMVLSENDPSMYDLLDTARHQLDSHGKGLPLDLWESLLDEASFSMRHYRLAHSTLEQLESFSLDQAAFPSERELRYFTKFRYLLALERHGDLIHGIQRYELDPEAFTRTVPLMDVHKKEADKVVLTTIPEAGVEGAFEGSRPVKACDIVLFVPLEAVGDLRAPGAFDDDFHRSANWQHPGAWVATVTSVKGDSRTGEEMKMHTRRISRFASDALSSQVDGELVDHLEPCAVGSKYRLFHIAMETPTARMLSALRCLCQVRLPVWSASFEGRKPSYKFSDSLRNVILGSPEEASSEAKEAPRIPYGSPSTEQVIAEMKGPRSQFNVLTPTQTQAVQRALDEKLSIIQGPPGTGKTHVACAIIASWFERYGPTGERILAVADSNVAADNLYTRLLGFGIPAVRVGQGKLEEGHSGEQLWQSIKHAQVVVATCIGSGMEMMKERGNAQGFQRVVIDECTQACETAALVALGKQAEQAVLIGDHNQLPATVLSKAAQEQGLGVSLFERMVLTNGVETTLLVEQRRMHSSISEFPNNTFYQGKLVNALDDASLAPVNGFPWPNPDSRVAFVDVAGTEQKRGFSAYNSAEAEAIADAVQKLLNAGTAPQELVVLTAYLAQRDEIRRAIRDRGMWQVQSSLDIDTVDGYQGMERDIVIFSAARANAEHKLGFLSDARRMNVMLTRARRGVIVFGNGDALRNSSDTESNWGAWLNWVESKGSVIRTADAASSNFAHQLSTPGPDTTAGLSQDPFAEKPAVSVESQGFSQSSLGQQGSQLSSSNGFESQQGFHDNCHNSAFSQQNGHSTASTFSSHQSSSSDSVESSSQPATAPHQNPEWQKIFSEQYGRHYYWNTTTNQTQWESPPGM